MIGFLKGLFGGKDDAAPSGKKDGTRPEETLEYKGHRIRPAPFSAGGQFQTAGFIEKDFGGETKSYRFVRVDKHSSRDDAVALTLVKGQQIIDEQGDRIYDAGK